jgi:hypothetical protein
MSEHMTAEEQVTAMWERAEACPHPSREWCCISLGGRGFTRITIPDTISGYAPTEAAAWQAALEFTLARQEEVRQIDADIKWAEAARVLVPQDYDIDAKRRTVGRLQAIRKELTRGMKER